MIPLTADIVMRIAGASREDALRLGGIPFADRKITFPGSTRLEAAGVGDGLGWVNARIYSLKCGADANPEVLTRSFYGGEPFTVDGYRHKAAPVFATLLRERCPTAVFRAVVFAWVNAINAVRAARSLSHVYKEVLKRAFPTVADQNPSPTPVGKILGLWVVATPLHCKPCSVLNTQPATSFVAVGNYGFRTLFNKFLVGAHQASPLLGSAAARYDASAP